MKSAVAHAIKTNHFPEFTNILSQCWKRACKGFFGTHFPNATFRETAIMRGWSINYEGLFSFTTTHDLCDASFTKKSLEQMVRIWYKNELDDEIERQAEFERIHPEFASIPRAGKALKDYTLDEFIFRPF